MSIVAIVLLLTSAVLHALWNLLLKQSEKKYITMGWQNILSGVFAILALFFTGLPPRSIWLFAVLSALLEAFYFGLLTFAYNDHDFSLVYPVARGAAPALVVVWSALFLSEIPSTGGLIGIVLIVAGLVVIGATSLYQGGNGAPVPLGPGVVDAGPSPARPKPAARPQFRGIATALSVAFVISVYTIVDGFAVRHGPALSYGLCIFALMPVASTPLVVSHYGWTQFRDGFREARGRLFLVGFIALVAYLFVLIAYSIAPVNYSEAIREVSVVLGAFAGWYFLGEEMGKIRIIGALAIFAGIAMIAILG